MAMKQITIARRRLRIWPKLRMASPRLIVGSRTSLSWPSRLNRGLRSRYISQSSFRAAFMTKHGGNLHSSVLYRCEAVGEIGKLIRPRWRERIEYARTSLGAFCHSVVHMPQNCGRQATFGRLFLRHGVTRSLLTLSSLRLGGASRYHRLSRSGAILFDPPA